jgi:hypothetical protein
MQAILLTELFTRFRGRQPNVKTSRQFEEVYRRVSQHSSDLLVKIPCIPENPKGTDLRVTRVKKRNRLNLMILALKALNVACLVLSLDKSIQLTQVQADNYC